MDFIGDVAAKTEARRMLSESPVEETVPVAFDETTTTPMASASASQSEEATQEDSEEIQATENDEEETEEEVLIELV